MSDAVALDPRCRRATRRRGILLAPLLFSLTLAGCDGPGGTAPQTPSDAGHGHHAASAPAPADQVFGLDVYAEGDSVHLLTAVQRAHSEAMELHYTRSHDGGRGWTAPVPIPRSAGETLYLSGHGGHPPQIAASGDRILVMYPIHGSGFRGSGPLMIRLSDDGGRSWRAAAGPADAGASNAQNFHDLLADEEGSFHTVWLDSRSGEQGLYHAHSADGGRTWSGDGEVDRITCQCCRNTLAAKPGEGLFILYRDLDPRDMALARSDDGGASWQRQGTVGRFDWHFDGCPHTGGGLVVGDGRVHATVWTGAEEHAGTYVLSSDDGGRNWTAPRSLGDAASRHTDLAGAGDGRLLAVWDAVEGDALLLRMAISRDAGASWEAPAILARSGHTLAHPRAVATESGFLVLWIEGDAGDGSRWRSLAVPAVP